MVTNTEKNLYNAYLRISRSAKNKPFTYRKDFTDFNDSDAFHINRISNLLSKYPHISPDDYFLAPFKVYPQAEHFTLEYYAGMGAVNAYTIYMKQIQEMAPDSDEQLEFIKRSLKHIGSFCIRNKIDIDKYPNFKTGLTFDWMKHIKKHEISIYVLMEFPEISNIIKEAAADEKELFLGEIGTYFWGYKSKYIQSKLAKQLVKDGMAKIKQIVNNRLNE